MGISFHRNMLVLHLSEDTYLCLVYLYTRVHIRCVKLCRLCVQAYTSLSLMWNTHKIPYQIPKVRYRYVSNTYKIPLLITLSDRWTHSSISLFFKIRITVGFNSFFVIDMLSGILAFVIVFMMPIRCGISILDKMLSLIIVSLQLFFKAFCSFLFYFLSSNLIWDRRHHCFVRAGYG